MPRFFIDEKNILNEKAFITGQDVNHITKVLRSKIGEAVTLCDGVGNDYFGEFISFSKDEIEVKINKKAKTNTEPSCFVTLFQALPKGEKSEIIIQKCVELGVSKIVFFLSKRCVSKPDEKAIQSKLKRWQEISLSAAKQSGRGIIPKIEFLGDYKKTLTEAKKAQLSVLFYEGKNTTPLKEILKNNQNIKSFSFIIGSEGGFQLDEVEKAILEEIAIGGLGNRILRAETASLCVLSALMYETDNL